MLSFKNWIYQFHEVFKFEKSGRVNRSLRKNASYKPGTFGIEIEFPYIREEELDSDQAFEDFKEQYYDHFYETVSERDYGVINFEEWEENNPEPLDKYDWEDENPRPEDEDEEDKWVQIRDDIAFTHDEWEEEREKVLRAWQRWENHGREKAAREEMRAADIWEYLDKDDYTIGGLKETTNEVGNILSNLGQTWKKGDATETDWGIGPDGDDIVELRSRYLTTKDFPMLLKLFSKLNSIIEHDINKSAHVHIGLQQYKDGFNAMDLLGVIPTIDEKKIIDIAGEERVLGGSWTKPNSVVTNVITSLISHFFLNNNNIKEVVVSNERMNDLLRQLDRYMGTNLKSFFKTGTIEFRYLSSDILKNPKKFLEVIQYYLMLPEISRKKMQIKLSGDNKTLYLTRMPGDKIKITTDAAIHPQMKVSDTRVNLEPSTFEKQKEVINKKAIENQIDKTKEYFSDINLLDFGNKLKKLNLDSSINDPRLKEAINKYSKFMDNFRAKTYNDRKVFDGNQFFIGRQSDSDYLLYKIAQFDLMKK